MRTWGKYTFEWAAQIRPEIDDIGAVQAFLPHAAYANPQNLELHPYGQGPFCKFRIPNNLDNAGVYLLLVNDAPAYHQSLPQRPPPAVCLGPPAPGPAGRPGRRNADRLRR